MGKAELATDLDIKEPVTLEEDTDTEETVIEKKVPILEEIKLAVAEYRDITNFAKSDYIVKEDIGWHLLFGDIGRHAINKTT